MTTDNEQAALQEMQQERLRQAGGEPDGDGTPAWFWVALIVFVIGGMIVFANNVDPCLDQRVIWWVNASGELRSCAFEAACAINDGSMPHVDQGEGYIYFDDDASEVCHQRIEF